MPPVLIKRVLRRDDVKGNLERARQNLQDFQDMENPADVFKSPAERRPLITKPKGMGRGGQGGRGPPPKPKSKPKPKPKPKPKQKGRGHGGGRGGNFQEQHQIPGDFQESNQFSDAKDDSQFMQIQPNQRNGRRGDSHENQEHPISLKELFSSKTPSSLDDSDAGKFRQSKPSKHRQGDCGRAQNRRGNRDAGQTGIRRAQSMSSVAEEGLADQSQFERNKIFIQGLSEKTSRDGLVNFIEARSGGEEVKDVQILKNGKALVTMADEIKGTYLSIKLGE